MDSPVIVIAVIALIFGIFNILLWLLIIKGDLQGESGSGKTSPDIQNTIFASEKRVVDTLTKMFTTLKSSSGQQNVVDSKKIAAELAVSMRGQNSGIPEIKKSVADLEGKITPVEEKVSKNSAGIGKILDELEKQREFIEAIDEHLVEVNRKSI